MPPLDWFFVVALVLYSLVIWRHWWHRKTVPKLRRWMLWAFGVALACDMSGTLFLCIVGAKGWTWTIHSVSGALSVMIMALHFAWALDAAFFSRGRCATLFNRFSLTAWGLWAVSFITGIPLH